METKDLELKDIDFSALRNMVVRDWKMAHSLAMAQIRIALTQLKRTAPAMVKSLENNRGPRLSMTIHYDTKSGVAKSVSLYASPPEFSKELQTAYVSVESPEDELCRRMCAEVLPLVLFCGESAGSLVVKFEQGRAASK